MVNAWSLAHDVLNGTLDENFPIMTGNIDINTGLGNTASTIPYLCPVLCHYIY